MFQKGVGFVTRKTANTLKPTVIIAKNGNEWTIKSNTSFKSSETKFVEGVEFEESNNINRKLLRSFINYFFINKIATMDGRKCKVIDFFKQNTLNVKTYYKFVSNFRLNI